MASVRTTRVGGSTRSGTSRSNPTAEAGPSSPRPVAKTPRRTPRKKAQVKYDEDDEDDEVAEIGRNMQSVLKVSEPVPQETVKRVAKAADKPVKATTRKAITSSSVPTTDQAVRNKTATTSRATSSSVEVKAVSSSTKPALSTTRPAASASKVTSSSSKTAATSVKASTATTKPAAAVSRQPANASAKRPVPETTATKASKAGPSRTTTSVPTTKTAARATPSASTSSAPTAFQRKPPIKIAEPSWADPSIDIFERAKSAMTTLNSNLKLIGAASSAGYQDQTCTKVTVEGEEVDEKTMEQWVGSCQIGLRILRECDKTGRMGKKSIDVDKAGLGLVWRCVGIKAHQWALEELVMIKESIIRRYTPVQTDTVSQSIKSDDLNGIPAAWYTTLSLPIPADDPGLDITNMLFQAVASAWISLLGIGAGLKSLQTLFTLPQDGPVSSIHPLSYAMPLPTATTSHLLTHIYRHLIAFSSRDLTAWLHARHVSLYTLALTISMTTRNTPAALWTQIQRTVIAYMKASNQLESEIAACSHLIRSVVSWVKKLLSVRGEEVYSWFEGKEWSELLDHWITLARKTRDRSTIDYALSLMTKSISLAPSTPPNKASSSTIVPETPASSLKSQKKGKKKATGSDAATEVVRIGAGLAQLEVALQAFLENPQDELAIAGAESALRSVSLSDLSDALGELEESSDTQALLAKAARAVERLRRACDKILNEERTPKALNLAAKHWIGCTIDLTEDVLHTPLDISGIARNLLLGSVQSTILLCNDSVPQSVQSKVDRIRRLILLSRSSTSSQDRADCFRSLAIPIYNLAVPCWRAEDYKGALALTKLSAEAIKEALVLVDDKEKSKDAWTQLDKCLWQRYEVIGSCQIRLQNKREAFAAYCSSLAYIPTPISQAIEKATKESSLDTVFAHFSDVTSSLNRAASAILADLDGVKDHALKCFASLDRLVPAVRGALTERIIDILSDVSNSIEVTELCLHLGDSLLKTYTLAEFPIRRLRVIAKMMKLVLGSGSHLKSMTELCATAREAFGATAAGEDIKLAKFKVEYRASMLICRALYAYGTKDQSRVLSDGREGMALLRGLLIPPTPAVSSPAKPTTAAKGRLVGRAGTVKSTPKAGATAARNGSRVVSDGSKSTSGKAAKTSDTTEEPKFHDLTGLSRLLSTFSSLLGMLGHVLVKIEALKLLRAMLRNQAQLADQYVVYSGLLATEYLRLGKQSKSKAVFTQTFRYIADSKTPICLHPRISLHLRHAAFLAVADLTDVQSAQQAFADAATLELQYTPPSTGGYVSKTVANIETIERAVLANIATAAIIIRQGNKAVTSASSKLYGAYKLVGTMAERTTRMAPKLPSIEKDEPKVEEDPFTAKPELKGANEPSKDALMPTSTHGSYFENKQLSGLQWHAADMLMGIAMLTANVLSDRGSAREAGYFLKAAKDVAKVVRAPIMVARIETRDAELNTRLRNYETSLSKLDTAAKTLGLSVEEGPESAENEATSTAKDVVQKEPASAIDAFELNRVRGDVFAKTEMVVEAGEMFDAAQLSVQGLEKVFNENEALMPTPRKLRASINAMTASVNRAGAIARSKSTNKDSQKGGQGAMDDAGMEVILLEQLKKVWRQQAWLLREAGFVQDSEDILLQIKNLSLGGEAKAEDLWLEGKIGLREAFNHFKTDLWLSSLTESTLAMPMGDPQQRVKDRRETRMSIQSILEKSERSFMAALEVASGSGRVEDVRTACLSLALLRAFQTSLGEGSLELTASAADILAAAPAITLQREMLEAIDQKLKGIDRIFKWAGPSVKDRSTPSSPSKQRLIESINSSENPGQLVEDSESMESTEDDPAMRAYWEDLRAKHASFSLLDRHDLSSLPADWVVISINVTEDRTTMFVSRHQVNHEPLVFTLPLDRQGKREGEAEAELFTFEAGVKQFHDIIRESEEVSKTTKTITTEEGRSKWWASRYNLDARMKDLVASMEFCWLGAFKTILSPKDDLPVSIIDIFRAKLEKIFNGALSAGSESRKTAKVHLDDTLLRTFATLSSKCKDEEAEDLVYFILDIYQFYGVQVALAELDIDQIGIDVKTALSELEALRDAHHKKTGWIRASEHMFLALDKNVSMLPWESIPILRGRAVSRIPSLPFLLDQVEMMNHLSPIFSSSTHNQRKGKSIENVKPKFDGKRKINTNRVFYILNSSGDLERTQTFFEPWIETMKSKGWKGIVGRSPTEMEMVDALTNYDLVLYFGHGGAEQYIRSSRIHLLKKCATVMLWGCSSGKLKDQGDLDRTGTAWSYVLGGCPSLVANLWDVTDRDIDRLSEDVFKHLNLDAAHVPSLPSSLASSNSDKERGCMNAQHKWNGGGEQGLIAKMGAISLKEGLSSVEAVSKAREECRLKYLTGAAPVVYGLPMYFH